MAVLELDENNFVSTVKDNDIVIVDFWAPWCGPCQSFAPIYDETSDEVEGVVFAKVNTEQEQNLASQFGIRSIPTLMVFREQIILFSEAGTLGKSELTGLLQQVKELDMEEVRKSIDEEEGKE